MKNLGFFGGEKTLFGILEIPFVKISHCSSPHRNKVQKRHNILYLFCTFYVPFD